MKKRLLRGAAVVGIIVATPFIFKGIRSGLKWVNQKTRAPIQESEIINYEHDGHRLIIYQGASGKGGIMHHPDCPCNQ